MNSILCAVVQIQRHEAPPGELHVPPESTAAQEQVSRLCYCNIPVNTFVIRNRLKKKKKNYCD